MKRKFLKVKAALSLFTLVASLFTGMRISSSAEDKKLDTGADECFAEVSVNTEYLKSDDVRVSSRFYELFKPKENKNEEIMLCPSGDAFGILIKEDGVTVCSSSASGILGGDRIIKINGRECYECEEVYEAVRESGGAPLNITLIREGKEICVKTNPKYKDGEYRLGITLRSRTAGIGTMTFIDPETLSFGGLGHAVSDSETGEPVTVRAGVASTVALGACKKGEAGKAGELSGVLGKASIGSVDKNTECGVFGRLDVSPEKLSSPLPIAKRGEVKIGDAEIISTIKNGKRATYKIEITDIDRTSEGSKSFKVKVTDEALIALTGGIVRGMSGSPIIQDGKLVGAVTHVMVANPTEGYGIFIENMLSAASQQAFPKAA